MLNIQLFIGEKRVDFFEDESIQLTDSIQDARDASKIFTAVSSDFTVPASVINNNIFKHFYSFDIVDGFDPRQKVKASILQNGFLYKKGFVQLRSVSLENNKASSYKIFFTGLLGELKDILKDDKLSDLLQLNQYSHPYSPSTIRSGLQNYFNVTNNSPTFTGATIGDMCYPFVSSVNRYAFGASGLRTVDENGFITDSKIQTTDLKPALRAELIIEAIEEKYSITFDSTFLKTDAKFTELYLWLNRSKGVLADDQTFDLINNVTSFEFVSGQAALNLSQDFITTEKTQGGNFIDDFINFNFEYQVDITGSGRIELQIIDGVTNQIFNTFSKEVEDETVNVSNLFESTEFGIDVFKPIIRLITETEGITEVEITLKVTKTERQNTSDFVQIGNYQLIGGGSVVAISNVSVPLQIPSMLIIDFLTSIFKTFNLTAFVKNDGTISVQTLDAFYDGGNTIDITNQIDISKSEVKRFEPYSEINFEFEESESLLMIERDKILDDTYGNLNFKVGSEDQSKLIGGGSYDIDSKFHKILPERLRLSNGANSNIMYALYLNEDLEPLSNQPILFYTKRNTFTASTAIQFENGTNLTSNIAPSNVKQDLSQTLNFGAEIDEFTLRVNNQSLFNNFYRTFVLRSFSLRSKILTVNAKLNADFILNYSLADTFVINNRKFNINTLDIDLGNGNAKLELRNVFNIPAIPTPIVPDLNQLTISSPSQSENDTNGSYTFTIFSNVSWNVSDDSSFISVSHANGTNNGTITVTYLENTTTFQRSGIVTVTGGGFTRQNTLTQTGKAVQLALASATQSVAKEAGSYTLALTSNTSWNITDNQTWLSVSPTIGTGNATLTITYNENLTASERIAIIQAQAGNVIRTNTLTQAEQATSQLFAHVLVRGSTKELACSNTDSQTYYTDESSYPNSNIIFFDDQGNNRVPAAFYQNNNIVLETNNNGEKINTLIC